MTNDKGTIDITETVDLMQDTFVKWGVSFIHAEVLAIPGLGPVVLFLIKFFLDPIVQWVLTKIAASSVMAAFFTNTAVRKASQAVDYVTAKKALQGLPMNASDKEYEQYERAEISAFNNFVIVTN
jgi:hypothetical protein